MKLRFYFVRQ